MITTEREFVKYRVLTDRIDWFKNTIDLIENDKLGEVNFGDLVIYIPKLQKVVLNILKQKLQKHEKQLEEL